MDWFSNLRNFLHQKMEEQQLTIRQLSNKSAIPLTTMRKLYDGERYPRLETIVKLADFFECSIDEMLGINSSSSMKGQKYTKLTSEELRVNLINFINNLLEKQNITLYQLGVKIGCSEDAFRSFLKKR
ncbi:helix-turn-helix domain-containing protein [Candidatus Tisiphia endosymbiont of Nemotelus uliginosus]|uniref:helix-turn-helix domain-containing protein n=1 Tax=Candidatus Tisiphia endosymbiont of Nemotelus uliginosus TaxID=3077926 RepID=UPI0035C8C1A5